MSLKYWVWLQNALGFGSRYTSLILEHFGSAENVYRADNSAILKFGICSKKTVEKLSDKSLKSADAIISECKKSGILIIPFSSQYYPEKLRQISSPPLLLYGKGDTALLNEEVSICIVGPRKVSTYGKKAAFSLAARLSLCGFTIISGGALGGDTAAHRGALSVSGKTICVLGSGINSNYLQVNRPIRDEIANNGLLISEFPPDYPASKITFPIRNRLLSGLTLGTVVVEAGEESGSLITANAAAEQGKDVFVIPGNPTDEHYKGSNALLRDGAKPLLELSDIITEYLPLYPHKIKPEKAYSQKISMGNDTQPLKKPKVTEEQKNIKKNIKENLSNNAKIVYNYLDNQIFYIDDLAGLSISNSEILAALTELEIFGYIEAQPGGKYSLAVN